MVRMALTPTPWISGRIGRRTSPARRGALQPEGARIIAALIA